MKKKMNICIYILFLALFFSCTPLYKQYELLNNNTIKNSLYSDQSKIIKSILSKEKKQVILVISWKKNILVKNGPLYYTALLYNAVNGEKKIIKTTEQNPDKEILLKITSDKEFKEYLYILENYLEGKDEYLLSLEDSFSSSEANSPYYLYDFVKNKKLKIKSFAFNKNGKIIQ
ncbi:MAG: hypothetical protein P0Y62_01750 [Candidatus Chryseobacterium colombiense]|nr:hypothetical protein [Chryseobacterium sp.]WEK70279.1 MAG: hypothetical protein P0Y62_01750 [Chryseobacterium sp.]